jgi:CubicO group peptidase (beta-lactamase class C family)
VRRDAPFDAEATGELGDEQLEETLQSIVDPTSLIVRFFSAEFGQPAPGATDVEHWLDVVKLAESIDGETPGTRMRYASATTTVLNHLVERLLNEPWTEVFAERVWSKLGARGPALFGLTPEGTAVAHGLVSTTLEDFSRYAIAFTPSWDKATNERIVSDEVLRRLQTGGDPAAYRDSATHVRVRRMMSHRVQRIVSVHPG